MRLFMLLLLCHAVALQAFAQKKPGKVVRLRFLPVLHGVPLQVSERTDGTDLQVSNFRFYVSGLCLMRSGRVVYRDPAPAHLVDAADSSSLSIALLTNSQKYTQISFNLGIDSITSCSGAHGGDLDPMRGMYWAWQSGYINLKLEGYSPQSTARKHQFHFHIGGYKKPFEALRRVTLSVGPGNEVLVLVDLDQLLRDIDMATLNSIMIPGEQAVLLAQKAAGIFQVK